MPKVLVVEDSPAQALRTQIALKSQGFGVLVENESRAAIEVAKAKQPDVVLSDVRMPGLDGFELCQARRRPRAPGHAHRAEQRDGQRRRGRGPRPLARRQGLHRGGPRPRGSVLRPHRARGAVAHLPPELLHEHDGHDVSGRGVGMDVVREAVELTHGMIDVDSRVGQGTRFNISLPLPVATTRCLMVEVGGHAFALPTSGIDHIVRLTAGDIGQTEGREAIRVDGRPMALARFGDVISLPASSRAAGAAQPTIVLGGFDQDQLLETVGRLI